MLKAHHRRARLERAGNLNREVLGRYENTVLGIGLWVERTDKEYGPKIVHMRLARVLRTMRESNADTDVRRCRTQRVLIDVNRDNSISMSCSKLCGAGI